MRQVLSALTKVLIKHENDEVARSIRVKVVTTLLSIIFTGEPRSKLKASLLSLEFVLRKHVIDLTEWMSLMQKWLPRNVSAWRQRLQQHGLRAFAFSTQKSLPDERQGIAIVESFSLALFFNAFQMDLAPAVGSLLSSFCRLLKETPSTHSLYYFENHFSFWVILLKEVLLKNIGILGIFATYVFPDLFRTDPGGFKGFVCELPLGDISTGLVHDTPEVTILFSALQVGKELGLVEEAGQYLNAYQNTDVSYGLS